MQYSETMTNSVLTPSNYILLGSSGNTIPINAVNFDFSEATRINDAQLLNRSLPDWGARTPYFICARGSSRGIQQSVLEQLGEEFRRDIGFVYLKTNSNTPARLEIPRWVYDAGLLEPVVDLIRAEVIVGNGK